jgi:hypothetical protein
MPTASDLVTDLPADFETFGQAVATSMADLLGGTTGQILAKASNTDMDFTWIANDQGDITGVTASSPLTGGGTSGAITIGILNGTTSNLGAVQLSDSTSSTSTTLAATANAVKSAYDLANAAIPKSLIDAAGDLIVGTAADTAGRLAIGTAGQVLKVNSGATALEWGTAAGGSTFSGCRVTNSVAQTTSNATRLALTFDTESFDTDAFHSTSSNTSRMTIPAGKAGKYLVTAGTTFATNANGNRETYIFLNGAIYSSVFQPGTSVGSTSISISDTLNLAVGDYVEIRVEQDSGSSVDVRGNNWGTGATFFTITYLGA